MDKKDAIEFLKKKVEEIPNLEKLPHSARGVILWRDSIEDVLENAFGRNSTQFMRFYNTRHKKLRSNKEYTQKTYISQLNRRKTAILSIINSWEVTNLHENTLVKIEPPKAFIVHGGKSGVLSKLCDFIEALGIKPLVVEMLPSKGMTVTEKVKKYQQEADCAIILATRGGIIDTKSGKEHPRLNVIDELSSFWEAFPQKVILLLEKGATLPSNKTGLTYEPFARQSMDRAFTAIVRELREMKILKAEKP